MWQVEFPDNEIIFKSVILLKWTKIKRQREWTKIPIDNLIAFYNQHQWKQEEKEMDRIMSLTDCMIRNKVKEKENMK